MQYLFDQWEQIKGQLYGKHILFFFDYDGTLTPIAETPQQAEISGKTKELLRQLSKRNNFKVAVISGRALPDIKNIIGLKEIVYVGNHGIEIEGPGIKFESQVSPRLRLVIRNLYKDILNNLAGIKGVLIEDKGLAISVHYRLMDPKEMPRFLRIFSEVTDPFMVRKKIEIKEGKKVCEIRPKVDWDKGKAVLWFLSRPQGSAVKDDIFPVYLGDDITDEDGFRILKNKGLTIFVGPPKVSEADYFVNDAVEVDKFMEQILGIG